jgi:hypothetical protein
VNIYFGAELFSGGALNAQQKTRRRETGRAATSTVAATAGSHDGCTGRDLELGPRRRHVGLLIGLYIAMLVYPFFEEWQQRRVDKERLAKMRKHHAMLLAGVHLGSHRPSG